MRILRGLRPGEQVYVERADIEYGYYGGGRLTLVLTIPVGALHYANKVEKDQIEQEIELLIKGEVVKE